VTSRQVDSKVTPEVMQTILLDELAGRLADIHQELVTQSPEGVIYSIPFSASVIATKIVLLYSATIYNDGAANIYILEVDRNISSSDAPLKTNESVSIDHKKRGQYVHYIKTLAGTATGRIFALR